MRPLASNLRIYHLLAAALTLFALSANAAEPDRQALIIGNGKYAKAPALDDPPRDADLMGEVLGKLGYRVHSHRNLDAAGMRKALRDFRKGLSERTEAIVYFSGHGVELDGKNYLVPVDLDAEFQYEAKEQCLGLHSILDALEGAKVPLRLVFLDCCRDTGKLLPGEKKSLSGGLADPGEMGDGVLVSFATRHGMPAWESDGDSSYSLYTAALAKHLAKPGVVIEESLREVAREVVATTGGKQRPFTYGSILSRVYLAGRKGEEVMNPPANGGAGVASSAATRLAELEAKLAKLEKERSETMSRPEEGAVGGFPADISKGFTNSLGMKFVPVPGTDVLFCEHETRVQDYAAYAAANTGVDKEWKDYEYKGQKQASDHPVVNVSWEDAKAFCAWLSKKEGKEYRLPTDHEWSVAVGIGGKENAKTSPVNKSGEIEGVYPWGTTWPPPSGAGNFSGSESASSYQSDDYRDRHPFTSPVGSYEKSRSGLYDLSGNVWEWCEDLYSSTGTSRVLRGGSWLNTAEMYLRSSYRINVTPTRRFRIYGFRLVVVGVGG